MSRLPTTTSAMTAAAALTLPEQDLNQAENQVSMDLVNSSATDNPANWAIATTVASDVASTLGATMTDLTTQRARLSNLSDSLTTGVGSLVDANMNEAGTKLAEQALSISNSDTRLILKLFEL
jgi:flagellin-like hook-associated protein FlgL